MDPRHHGNPPNQGNDNRRMNQGPPWQHQQPQQQMQGPPQFGRGLPTGGQTDDGRDGGFGHSGLHHGGPPAGGPRGPPPRFGGAGGLQQQLQQQQQPPQHFSIQGRPPGPPHPLNQGAAIPPGRGDFGQTQQPQQQQQPGPSHDFGRPGMTMTATQQQQGRPRFDTQQQQPHLPMQQLGGPSQPARPPAHAGPSGPPQDPPRGMPPQQTQQHSQAGPGQHQFRGGILPMQGKGAPGMTAGHQSGPMPGDPGGPPPPPPPPRPPQAVASAPNPMKISRQGLPQRFARPDSREKQLQTTGHAQDMGFSNPTVADAQRNAAFQGMIHGNTAQDRLGSGGMWGGGDVNAGFGQGPGGGLSLSPMGQQRQQGGSGLPFGGPGPAQQMQRQGGPAMGQQPGYASGGPPQMPQGRTNLPPHSITSTAGPPGVAQAPHGGQGDTSDSPQGDAGENIKFLRVEDALLYLDDVKREFKDQPRIYNEFLVIMKNFKSHLVDTPGVIARVSKLFRGYNKLILGFNTFLPEGYKISHADLERADAEREAVERAEAERAVQQQESEQRPAWAANRYGEMEPVPNSGKFPSQQQQRDVESGSDAPLQPSFRSGPPAQQKKPPPPAGKTQSQNRSTQQGPSGQMQPHQAGSPQPQVEFDHAISYVTTIKRRFTHDPTIYHAFLEILHTYQKEQRGIKEVLEQVAHLFQDHPDLLKEFTFFLPEAVQEQAKERLHRAAAESESRLASIRQAQMEQYNRGQKFVDMTMQDAQRRRSFDAMASGAAPMVAPENYVYNSAVERQFFDATREALTSMSRDGGQAWAEFLKCLDMYAQEILSRNEMLAFVEPLLGKRNTKLFEEFKRVLAAAGSQNVALSTLEDAWYSVPLSEIDFSRCRRCTPSYRALPRDYPAPPCSDRSLEEIKVLNDIWVSLPVGSEESYTFRHMRRNTYEETLFRCEDERFEIDMVIDSNAATLHRLLPVAEEITQLALEEQSAPDLGSKTPVEGTGLGGNRFQYIFDSSILGVIHRNSIARIYGDAGQEMLELMTKNPTVAIPLVVQRLKQKDEEWRVARDRLQSHWKELAEHNYHKSLDHRSLTWRTTDKRATSTRTVVAEIKDRAANNGAEGKEALRLKMDKAKEEHGTFYEVTKGQILFKNLDSTLLPKPDRRMFTPHLSLLYANNSWVQRDAYRILAYALERGSISPADKERCHRLWFDCLGPFFGLSLNWMQRPAAMYDELIKNKTTLSPVPASVPTTTVSEDDEEDSADDDMDVDGNVVTEELRQNSGDKGKDVTDHHPLPRGVHVSTLYGEGTILNFRPDERMYSIALQFGATGFVRPSAVLCSIMPVEKSAYTRQLRSEDQSKLARSSDQLIIGTQSLYLFFRLHQILCDRLNTAKHLAYTVGADQSLQTMVEQMTDASPQGTGRRRYEAYLSLLYVLLDGGGGGAAEGGKYEDRVRSLLGHGAYELATMDKLISHIWKNLQSMVQDETMWNLVQVYRRHRDAGSFQPEAFRQEAAYLSDGEVMYAFQHCPVPGKDDSVLYTEYLDVMDESSNDASNDDDDEAPAAAAVVAQPEEPVAKKARRG